MKNKHIEVRTKFRALTSLNQATYELLFAEFKAVAEEKLRHYTLRGKVRKKIKYKEAINSSLYGSRAKFTFILLYLKHHCIQELYALFFQMSQAKVSQWIAWLIPVVKKALDRLGVLAKKSIAYVHKNQTDSYLAADVTEVRVQRKTDFSAQKQDYSGKQKAHTSKYFALCSPDRYIHYISESYTGATHDYSIWKEQSVQENGVPLFMDLGFLGAESDDNLVILPFKKPKNQELSASAKLFNQSISRARVVIENAFSSVKRLKIATDKIRLKCRTKIEQIRQITVGLHNLRVISHKLIKQKAF